MPRRSIGNGQPDRGDAAARLAARKARILEVWAHAVCREVPAAEGHSRPALFDSIPDLIDRIVEALADVASGASNLPVEPAKAREHGVQRAAMPEYTLDQMLAEYHLLHRTLVAILTEDATLSPAEHGAIESTVFAAIRTSAQQFAITRAQVAETRHGRKLAEAEQRHNLLVEAVRDYAIFTLDVDGIIMTWNPGCERMKQFTSDETIGHHFEMLYPPEGRRRNEPREHLKSALIEGRFRGEGLRMRKDGSLFLADVTIAPMYLDGKLVGFGKVVENVDERSRLMQERDLSRTEAQTLRIQQGLRETFVSALTHDLRTPLSAARMSAQLIARKPDDAEINRRLAVRVVSNLDRMDAMIRDLLDAGRIRAGESIPLEITQCDLTAIASDACDELISIHGARFRVDRTTPLVGYWSPDGMRRILENLLTNAEKYGDPTSPITVGFKEVEDRVFVTVHNHGAPIPAEDQPWLFDQYRRSKSAESGTQRGWGLGLTLVRGLAEAQGGIVKVESAPIEGTRFTVDLPRDARAPGPMPRV